MRRYAFVIHVDARLSGYPAANLHRRTRYLVATGTPRDDHDAGTDGKRPRAIAQSADKEPPVRLVFDVGS